MIGPNDDSIGPRLPAMGRAYDPDLLAELRARGRRHRGAARRRRLHRLALAILLRGMGGPERVALTGAMMRSGEVLRWDLDRPMLDKQFAAAYSIASEAGARMLDPRRRMAGPRQRSRLSRRSASAAARGGVRLTLGSDDPAYFGATPAGEYSVCAEHFGMAERDLLELTTAA